MVGHVGAQILERQRIAIVVRAREYDVDIEPQVDTLLVYRNIRSLVGVTKVGYKFSLSGLHRAV